MNVFRKYFFQFQLDGVILNKILNQSELEIKKPPRTLNFLWIFDKYLHKN